MSPEASASGPALTASITSRGSRPSSATAAFTRATSSSTPSPTRWACANQTSGGGAACPPNRARASTAETFPSQRLKIG